MDPVVNMLSHNPTVVQEALLKPDNQITPNHLARLWSSSPEAINASLLLRFSSPQNLRVSNSEFQAFADELFRLWSDEQGRPRGRSALDGIKLLRQDSRFSWNDLRIRAAKRLWNVYQSEKVFRGKADLATLRLLWKYWIIKNVRSLSATEAQHLQNAWVAYLLPMNLSPPQRGHLDLVRATVVSFEEAVRQHSLSVLRKELKAGNYATNEELTNLIRQLDRLWNDHGYYTFLQNTLHNGIDDFWKEWIDGLSRVEFKNIDPGFDPFHKGLLPEMNTVIGYLNELAEKAIETGEAQDKENVTRLCRRILATPNRMEHFLAWLPDIMYEDVFSERTATYLGKEFASILLSTPPENRSQIEFASELWRWEAFGFSSGEFSAWLNQVQPGNRVGDIVKAVRAEVRESENLAPKSPSSSDGKNYLHEFRKKVIRNARWAFRKR